MMQVNANDDRRNAGGWQTARPTACRTEIAGVITPSPYKSEARSQPSRRHSRMVASAAGVARNRAGQWPSNASRKPIRVVVGAHQQGQITNGDTMIRDQEHQERTRTDPLSRHGPPGSGMHSFSVYRRASPMLAEHRRRSAQGPQAKSFSLECGHLPLGSVEVTGGHALADTLGRYESPSVSKVSRRPRYIGKQQESKPNMCCRDIRIRQFLNGKFDSTLKNVPYLIFLY